MSFKFLRQDGWFQTVAPADISISTTTSTAFLTFLTKATTADIALPNSFTDGPVVSQGSSGTWFATGTITFLDTAGAATFFFKLWDGTTTIASCDAVTSGAGTTFAISLSGCITSPAGNLRISAGCVSGNGTMKFNSSGASADSNITAIRIG